MPKRKRGSKGRSQSRNESSAALPKRPNKLRGLIFPHRVLLVVYTVMAVAAFHEVTHEEIQDITERELYLDPDHNLADVAAKLYPQRSFTHLSRAYQAVTCGQLGFTVSPICDQFQGGWDEIRADLERALATGDKSQEPLFRNYIQILLNQGEDAAIVADAVRQWRINFPSSKKPDPRIAHLAKDPILALTRNTNPGYVGTHACRECHIGHVEEFVKTRHFLASGEVTPESVNGHFGAGDNIYRTRNPNLWFEMDTKGDRLLQTAVRKTDNGLKKRTEELELVYGAGTFEESYHYWHGNQLFQLPVAWLRSVEQWRNAPGFFDGIVNFQRAVRPRCLECHSTWFDYFPGSVNAYSRENYVLGISCERCHGPGAEHVAYHQSRPDEDIPKHIINPKELTRERQIDVCAQCHSEANRLRKAPFTYMPGEPLDAYFATDAPKHPELEHTANQTQYMLESACFQASETLTCVTCHNPHHASNRTDLVSHVTACYKCHQANNCSKQVDLPAAIRERCIDCHMPTQHVTKITFNVAMDNYGMMSQRHQHRIGIYPGATKATIIRWLRTQPNQTGRQQAEEQADKLAQAHAAKADTFRHEQRYVAALSAYQEALEFAPALTSIKDSISQTMAQRARIELLQQQSRAQVLQLKKSGWRDKTLLAAAISKLTEILEMQSNLVSARTTLGVLQTKSGNIDEALLQLNLAIEIDPEHTHAHLVLGQLKHQGGRLQEALSHYRRAEELEPYDPKVHINLGLVLADRQQFTRAEEHFREALKIDPTQAEGYNLLASVMIESKRFDGAIPIAKRAVQLSKYQNPALLETLAKAYAGNGDETQAEAVRQRAATLVRTTP